jgi:hypothetical protein
MSHPTSIIVLLRVEKYGKIIHVIYFMKWMFSEKSFIYRGFFKHYFKTYLNCLHNTWVLRQQKGSEMQLQIIIIVIII